MLGQGGALARLDVSEPAAVAEWCRSDELFVGGKQVRTGPPPSYAKVRGIIERRLRRI